MYQNTERCVEGKESDSQDGGGKGYLYPKDLEFGWSAQR